MGERGRPNRRVPLHRCSLMAPGTTGILNEVKERRVQPAIEWGVFSSAMFLNAVPWVW